MKYNIYINQKGLENDKNITIKDASVIDWLFTFSATNNNKINYNKVDGFTWVDLNYMITDMPLLRIQTKSGASKLLSRLEELGYIEIKREPRKLFFKPTKKMISLYVSGNENKVSHRKLDSIHEDTVSIPQETKSIPEETYHNTIILDNNTTIIEEEKITLPKNRGKTAQIRLLSIYGTLFYNKYGINGTSNISQFVKVFSELLNTYSEIQIAMLLIIFFSWKGIDGRDNKEYEYLLNKTFSIYIFKANTTKYEVYARNILNIKFDDSQDTLTWVAEYMNSIK